VVSEQNQNVTALITCKYNPDFFCCYFNEILKSSKDFLKKVLPTEKHDLANA